MSEIDRWLSDYGDSHRDICYPVLYWSAVPALVVGAVSLLWSLPAPLEFSAISPLLNWGSTFLMVALIYYFIISVSLAVGMLPFVFGLSALALWLERAVYPLHWLGGGLLLAGIAGLYAGQHANGGARAVLRDIQLMMIAPVWLLSNLYRRLGIPY
ncbi:MAG: DUF962 domain-containing protein [Gammaproteobacteria bacterium]|nr:MAG: DUF962 domain-containing protein [Gammaproteobacteria bacterium]